MIQTTNVDKSPEEGSSGYSMNGENNTEDRVFLLSYKEAFMDYFSDDKSRICFPTGYAKTKCLVVDKNIGSIAWQLRSLGDDHYAACVSSNGSRYSSCIASICVRPALWVNLDADIF